MARVANEPVFTVSSRPIRPLASRQTPGTGTAAKIVAKFLTEIFGDDLRRAIDWRPVVHATIEQLATECSTPNWDGYSARSISTPAKEAAQDFVQALPSDLPQPEPLPDPDGTFSLCWDFGENLIFSVNIDAASTASYAGLLGRGVKRHGQEPFRGEVPRIVVESVMELQAASAASQPAA